MSDTKICKAPTTKGPIRGCLRILPLTAFDFEPGNSGGLRHVCKECRFEYRERTRKPIEDHELKRCESSRKGVERKGCGKLKPATEFPKNSSSVDGRTRICRDCLRAVDRPKRYWERSREKQLAKLPPKPDRCEICGDFGNSAKKGLHRDHDHETGAFRGSICWYCNIALPWLEQTPGIELLARDYLRKHRQLNFLSPKIDGKRVIANE